MKITTPMQITAADSNSRTISGRIVAFEEEVENRLADSQVQIERPIDKLELPDAAIEQRLHRRQKRFELRLPDGNFEGRQAELAGKRATA